MSGLYDADILTWSERQAALLRRIAAGDAPNELPDWTNIIDEVESVGRSETRACASLLVQMLLHRLKLTAWPHSTAAEAWADEVARRRFEAAEAFAPSMRQKLDVARLHREALRALGKMPKLIDGREALPVPQVCTETLDELLAPPP